MTGMPDFQRQHVSGLAGERLLLAAADREAANWLAERLAGRCPLDVVELAADAVAVRYEAVRPGYVFVDFGAATLAQAVDLVTRLKLRLPKARWVALGTAAEAAGPLAALRAGVEEFIDRSVEPAAAAAALEALLGRAPGRAAHDGKVLALLGAREGVGTSLLASQLAWCAQTTFARDPGSCEVALLDLGLPQADALFYLNLTPGYSFAEAAGNLRRFDQTLVQTAFTQTANGLRVLALPADLAAMRSVPLGEAQALVERLRAFFEWQVADLGGFSNADFVARVAGDADLVWLVCEQSAAAVLSGIALLDALEARGMPRSRVGLVVNRYDARVGFEPEQMAERLGAALVAQVPERRAQLLDAANQGALLVATRPRDPYSLAVSRLVHGELLPRSGQAPAPAPRKSLLNHLWPRKSHDDR